MVKKISPKTWQMMTFPPQRADSKNLISFFADFWARVTPGARGSVSVGFWEACQLSPFGGGGGPSQRALSTPPPPGNESPRSHALSVKRKILTVRHAMHDTCDLITHPKARGAKPVYASSERTHPWARWVPVPSRHLCHGEWVVPASWASPP